MAATEIDLPVSRGKEINIFYANNALLAKSKDKQAEQQLAEPTVPILLYLQKNY